MPKQQGPPWWSQQSYDGFKQPEFCIVFPMGGFFMSHVSHPKKSDPNKGVEALPLPERVHQLVGGFNPFEK